MTNILSCVANVQIAEQQRSNIVFSAYSIHTVRNTEQFIFDMEQMHPRMGPSMISHSSDAIRYQTLFTTATGRPNRGHRPGRRRTVGGATRRSFPLDHDQPTTKAQSSQSRCAGGAT